MRKTKEATTEVALEDSVKIFKFALALDAYEVTIRSIQSLEVQLNSERVAMASALPVKCFQILSIMFFVLSKKYHVF